LIFSQIFVIINIENRKEKSSMFIKILTPNHNGKIELAVTDLEALIQEAVDKAVREKCVGCTRPYLGSVTYLSNGPSDISEKTLDWSKVTCGSYQAPSESSLATNINKLIGE
jgi:hypothetical protein